MEHEAYDRGAIVFSPEGRLMQVEYARVAVRQGNTIIGITAKDGVLLCVNKKHESRLEKIQSIEKIYQVDQHIGMAFAGAMGDARVLVEKARYDAQFHRLKYDEDAPIEFIAKTIGNHMQAFTQYGGLRPFGTSFLIAGFDRDGSHLYDTDPSGSIFEYYATALGTKRNEVIEFLDVEYHEKDKIEDAIPIAFEIMAKFDALIDESIYKIDMAIIDNHGFRFLNNEEKRSYMLKSKNV